MGSVDILFQVSVGLLVGILGLFHFFISKDLMDKINKFSVLAKQYRKDQYDTLKLKMKKALSDGNDKLYGELIEAEVEKNSILKDIEVKFLDISANMLYAFILFGGSLGLAILFQYIPSISFGGIWGVDWISTLLLLGGLVCLLLAGLDYFKFIMIWGAIEAGKKLETIIEVRLESNKK